jgi:UDP-N-acetylmuramate--alanine ligase
LADIQENFVAFFRRVPFYGTALTNADSPGLMAVAERIDRRHRTFAVEAPADIVAADLRVDSRSSRFHLVCDGDDLGEITIPMPGRYNAENALAACAVALELDVPFAAIAEALGCFATVARRFDVKGEMEGVTVVDDYAHHPTEVAAVLGAGRDWLAGSGRLIAIFQPHLFSRTQRFHREFADALRAADGVILAPIYPAREKPIAGVSSGLIADDLADAKLPLGCELLETLEAVPEAATTWAQSGDLVMTIGAGTIYRTGPLILKALQTAEVDI